MNNVMEVSGLGKSYGKAQKPIIKDVTFSISKGEKIAIIGKSGSGKSTILNAIIGAHEFESGTVSIMGEKLEGQDIGKFTDIRKEHISVIYQHPNLIDDLTLYENVKLAQSIKGYSNRGEIMALLDMVGMNKFGNHFPSRVSGGQMQKIAIARALVGKPDIIIADEPTGNLDEKSTDDIIEILLNLSSSMIIVTHDMDLAKKMNRTYTLSGATLKQEIF